MSKKYQEKYQENFKNSDIINVIREDNKVILVHEDNTISL